MHYCSDMDKVALVIPAAEANRQFSQLLRAARSGARITITSHGEPVAVMGPVEPLSTAKSALDALEAHWATLEPRVIGGWSRDTLYDRETA